MKNVITFIALLIITVCACEKESQNNKEVDVREESSEIKETFKPVFMTDELDEFHPDSEFESISR